MLNSIQRMIMQKIISIQDAHAIIMKKLHYMMLPARGFAVMWQEIGNELGDEVLYDIGFTAGEDGAEEIIQLLGFKSTPIPMRLRILMRMFEVLGFGIAEWIKFDTKKKQVICHTSNQPVIEEAARLYGQDSRICHHYMGIYASHMRKELGIENAELSETQCVTKGNKFCEWVTGVNFK